MALRGCFLLLILLTVLCNNYAQNKADSLQPNLNQKLSDKDLVDLYNNSFLEFEFSDTTKAKGYLIKSMNLAKKIHYSEGLAKAYQYFGYYYEDVGNYARALLYYEHFLAVSKEKGMKESEASAYNNIANILIFQANYTKAVEYLQQALQIGEDLNNINIISKCVNNIGISYYYLGSYDLAVEFYERSIKLAEELGDVWRIGAGLDNLGLIYHEIKDYDKALEYHKKSLEIRKELEDTAGIASCYHNMGIIYSKLADSTNNAETEALEYYRIALEMNRSTNNKRQMVKCLHSLAIFYFSTGRHKEAIKSAEEGLHISKEIGTLEDQKNLYSLLSDIQDKEGDYKNALNNFIKYHYVYDSLNNFENVKKTAQLEMQHAFDKKEKEREFSQMQSDLLKEEELKQQKLLRNFFIFGSLLLIIVVLFIYRSYRHKQRDNKLLASQKAVIEEKNTEITDSIKYAKRIQEAIMPPEKKVSELLPSAFVFYQPKDIVSGDFYWIQEKKDMVFFAVVDCTGHGVPGAFISIMAHGGLNRAVNEFKLRTPAAILDKLNEIVNETLAQSYEESAIRDGLDIALCCYNRLEKTLQYSGAYNPLIHCRNRQITEIKANQAPIGSFIGDEVASFTNHVVEIQNNDMIYLFSDGYADQFGGENPEQRKDGGKKYKSKNFKDFLASISELEMTEQNRILREEFNRWKGELDQLDDICIIGVRF